MSTAETPSEDGAHDKPGLDLKSLVPLASLAVSALALIVVLILAIQTSGLGDEIAALRKQTKALVRTTQAVGDDVAAMNARSAATAAASTTAAKRPAPPVEPAAPSHVDAASPQHDCVIRPGKGDGLSNCLKENAGKSAH